MNSPVTTHDAPRAVNHVYWRGLRLVVEAAADWRIPGLARLA